MGRLVGYGVSQVPTNGMLGGMAYQDPVNVSVNILRVGTPGGNFQPGNGNNASLALSGIFTGSYTPSGSLGSLYAKATVLGIANDAGVTENNAAVIGFSCLNASGFNSQAYFGAVSSPESGGDFGRGAVLVWGRRSGGNYTESMRISRTGDVGIGSIQPASGVRLDVLGGEIRAGRIDSSNEGGQLSFSRASDNATAWYIDVFGNTSTPDLRFVDATTGTVRTTITSIGHIRMVGNGSADSNATNCHVLVNNVTNSFAAQVYAKTASFTNNVLGLYTDTSAGTGFKLIYGVSNNSNVFEVYGNGDVKNTNNSYTAISDLKLKENIVNAESQWSDIKSLQVRKFNFKESTGYETHTQIGLIAQEVELTSPGLVSEFFDRDENGNDLKTVTKSVNYSVLYMKAVKALQEAMDRIETLEAKVQALETK